MILTRRKFLASSSLFFTCGLRTRVLFPAALPRLARKDSFFGIHLDLHPNQNDTILGRDITEEMIESFLDRVKPDYVQYDCKGHPGYAGYPTKVGTPSPGIVQDSLALWRRVTARRGVALYVHYSGVWDEVACSKHPEWAALRADGTPDKRNTSTFGPYVDELLIPQLIEVAKNYDLDGAWIDGECWAVGPDYSVAAARAFQEETGRDALPKTAKEPGWHEFLELNRRQFRKYVHHYVDALHAAVPRFQVASNWLYSTFAPEKPELPVDFLSGDYLGNASISTARLEARYLGSTGKPWDLMAWGFQRGSRDHHNHKPAVQLMQEASVVLAQGGGFQVYFVPSRGGYLAPEYLQVMEQVARYCRERQLWCHKSTAVPEIGLLFSSHSLYRESSRLFGGWGSLLNPARGVLDALVEGHYSVDVIPDWRLAEALQRYRLIVVPDWPDIGGEARQRLARYAREGGTLLSIGAENALLFAADLGINTAESARQQPAFVKGREVLANVQGSWLDVQPQSAEILESRFPTIDSRRDAVGAATVTATGKGRIAAIYGPVGSLFAAYHAPAVREFLDRIVRRLFTPQAELDGPASVEVVLRRKNDQLLAHLINTTGMQVAEEYAVTDFVPAVGPLVLHVRLPRAPTRVTCQPDGTDVEGDWREGVWTAHLTKLTLHDILVFSE